MNNLTVRASGCVLKAKQYIQSSTPSNGLVDRSRTGANGTFSNVTWVQLPSGLWVASYNGTTSYTEIPDNPALRLTQGGTLMAWIKPNSEGENIGGRIIDKSSALGGTNGYSMSCQANNTVSLGINGGSPVLLSSTQAITFSSWQLAVSTFSLSGRKLYVNGADVTASGGSETGLPPNVSGVVCIGNRAGATDRTFDGYISGERIYNRVLSATEILRIYNSEKLFYGIT